MEETSRNLLDNLTLEPGDITVIVGAGASVDSGLKTYRGDGGVYQNIRAEELASVQGFQKDPKLVWEWYSKRIEKVLLASPNPIHKSLVRLEKSGLLSLVITQNVDGLHRRAGQQKLIEVHGTILKTHCFNNCGISKEVLEAPKTLPVSCECGSYQRPSVVWFGEKLSPKALFEIQNTLEKTKLLLVIGTSGTVYPVAQFPFHAKDNGARIVDFNIYPTPFQEISDLFIQGPGEQTIPKFIDLVLTSQ